MHTRKYKKTNKLTGTDETTSFQNGEKF